jgi:hypothetical protein
MKAPRHNVDFIVPIILLIMIMEDISIKRRQHMVRSLREAGISFDEIVTILRVGSHCAEQADLRKNPSAEMPDGNKQHGTQAL